MVLQVILLLAGLALIVFGADWLVDGASGIARKAGVSEFVIGLTIVGFGTSCPELVVSLTGAFQGLSDISIGNVLGSNIFNTLLILGLTAVIMPITITQSNKLRDIPINLCFTVVLILFGHFHQDISRLEGALFVLLFAAYIWYCFTSDKPSAEEAAAEEAQIPLGKAIFLVILGLAGLVVGGRLFVDSATAVATALGVSQKFIAITILAGGTSLPELATCVVAAAKKKGQLALGNIIGSNIFNILLILGASALVHPISYGSILPVDEAVLLVSVLLLFISSYTNRKNCLDRVEGAIMLACEAGYLVWLFLNAA